jgi:hypothetical protein
LQRSLERTLDLPTALRVGTDCLLYSRAVWCTPVGVTGSKDTQLYDSDSHVGGSPIGGNYGLVEA